MNRALRKFIAFSSSVAVLSNVSLIGASAKYVAEQVDDKDFETVIQMGDKSIYIEDGNGDWVGSDQLVVIDADGKKKVIDLEDGISGLYNYVSTTITDYNFICPTQADYTFDFYDPNFRVSTENGSLIVRYSDGYAIMNDEGKVVSKTYDRIQRINDDYFEVAVIDWAKADSDDSREEIVLGYGVVDSSGKEIIAPDLDCSGIYLTSDGKNFLVTHDEGKDYFTDLTGKKVSDEYDEINGIVMSDEMYSLTSDDTATEPIIYNSYNYYRDLNFGKIFRLNTAFYVFDSDGKKQVGFEKFTPSGESYDRVYLDSAYEYDDDGMYTESHVLICRTETEDGETISDAFEVYDGIKVEKLSNYDEVLHEETFGVKNPESRDIIYNDDRAMYGDKYTYYTKRDKDGNVEVYDKNKKLVFTSKTINKTIGGLWATVGDVTYLYDHDLRVIDEYDEIVRNGSTIFAENSEGNVVYNEFLEVIGKDVPEEIKNATVLNTGDKLMYFVYDKENTELTVYNEKFEKTGVLKHEYENENADKTKTYSYISLDYNTPNCMRWYVTEYCKFEDDPETEYSFDTQTQYTFNEKGEVKPSGDKTLLAGYGNYFRYRDDEDSSWKVMGAEGTALDKLPSNCTDLSYYVKDGKVYYIVQTTDGFTIYNEAVEKVHEFKTSYNFPTTTGSLKTDLSSIIMNDYDEKTEKNHIVIYDAYADEIKYEAKDTDETAYASTGNTVVLIKFEKPGSSLWTDDHEHTKRIIDTNGNEILAPMKGVDIEVKDYFFEPPTGSSYSRVIVDADIVDETENGLIGDHGDLFAIITSDKLYYSHNIVRENESGVCVPIKDIDTEYCKKYGYVIAIKADDECYIVCKDTKWGMCDSKGNVLHEPDFDMICEYKNGVARTVRYAESKRTMTVGYSDPTEVTPILAECGIIDKYGKELVEPFYNYEEFRSERSGAVIRDGEEFRVKKPFEENEKTVTDREKRYNYYVFDGKCINNEFAIRYGYSYAEKYDDYYVVTKNGLKGIVSPQNEIIVPIEYADVLSLRLDDRNTYSVRTEQVHDLMISKADEPIKKYEDGSMLVNVRTTEGKIRAFKITNDGTPYEKELDLPENVGDLDGNEKVNSSDASEVLSLYSETATGGEIKATVKVIADVNGDEKVDSSDATFVLSYYSYNSTGGKENMKTYMEKKMYLTD